MNVDILDAHDRHSHLIKQNFNIAECCEDLIKQRPFGNYAFYIWVHARTDDCGIRKRLVWQPRLSRPKPQTNSMLFKANPIDGEIRICWMIPAIEMFEDYKKGNVTEHDITHWSIKMFENNRAELEKPEHDDLSDEQIDAIYKEISQQARRDKRFQDIYGNALKA